MAREFLGGFELLVLLALMRLGDEAYGVPIADAIEESSGRDVALGSVYITLERLERKGLVSSRLGEPTAERGGRAKTYFRITAKGLREVRRARKTLINLWQGVPRLEGGVPVCIHVRSASASVRQARCVVSTLDQLVAQKGAGRGLVMTFFLASQVVPCMLYLRVGFMDWLREPSNPIGFFNVFWYSIFTFIAIPAAIMWGTRHRIWATRQRPVTPARL
jgi:PadR family transcriptional regulator